MSSCSWLDTATQGEKKKTGQLAAAAGRDEQSYRQSRDSGIVQLQCTVRRKRKRCVLPGTENHHPGHLRRMPLTIRLGCFRHTSRMQCTGFLPNNRQLNSWSEQPPRYRDRPLRARGSRCRFFREMAERKVSTFSPQRKKEKQSELSEMESTSPTSQTAVSLRGGGLNPSVRNQRRSGSRLSGRT